MTIFYVVIILVLDLLYVFILVHDLLLVVMLVHCLVNFLHFLVPDVLHVFTMLVCDLLCAHSAGPWPFDLYMFSHCWFVTIYVFILLVLNLLTFTFFTLLVSELLYVHSFGPWPFTCFHTLGSWPFICCQFAGLWPFICCQFGGLCPAL